MTERPWWWTAIRTGVTAALSAAMIAVVVSLLCWLPGSASGHALSAVRAGLLAMLSGHHGGLTLNGLDAQLTPLTSLAVLLFIAHRAGLTLAVDDRAEPWALLGVQTGAYAACCLALIPLAQLGTSRVAVAPTLFACAVVFGLGSASGFLYAGTWTVGLRDGVRLGVVALCGYLTMGAVLTIGSLLVHAHEVMQLSRQVGGGLSGWPVLVLGMLCAPNAVVAASAYVAGPGFAVGAGSGFTLSAGGHGVEPAFPLLGALPDGAAPVAVLVLNVAGVVAVGALVGWSAWRRADGLGALRLIAEAALVAGGLMAVLAWLGGGGVGSGRLHTVGASAWQVGFAVGIEVALSATFTVALLGLWLRFSLSRPLDVRPDAEPERVGAGL